MYGFYGRLNESFPSQINVDLTDYCNYACIHCPQSLHQKDTPRHNLSPEINCKMVDQVSQDGKGICEYIRYTGGEPLLHPHVYEMIQYAVQHSDSTVTLTTNGSALNDDNLEKLINTGVHLIDFSLDAYHDDTYKKIRINGKLSNVREIILKLLHLRQERGLKMKIVVSFVEQVLNTAEKADFEQFWKAHGVDFVIVRRLHTFGGAMEEQQPAADQRKPCLYPWERIMLNASGVILYCPNQSNSFIPINFNHTSIKDVWQGIFYQQLRDMHLSGLFSSDCPCVTCPDWKTVRWPDEGRAYADMIEDFQTETE